MDGKREGGQPEELPDAVTAVSYTHLDVQRVARTYAASKPAAI